MGTTVLGAMVAVVAMHVLWPEREHIALSKLLGRGAAADAAYVRAMLQFWATSIARGLRQAGNVAPARRRCGLSINDARDSGQADAGAKGKPASRWEEH
jgi:hypothetical protein